MEIVVTDFTFLICNSLPKAPFVVFFTDSSFVSPTNNIMTFWYLRTLYGRWPSFLILFQINSRALNILFPVVWQGVRPGHSVHASEPGSELAVWAGKHRPAHRLQVQYGRDDNRCGPQQCAVPGPYRWRSDQAAGRAPPSSLVRSPNPFCLPNELLRSQAIQTS